MDDFLMAESTLREYKGPGGDVKIPDGVKTVGVFAFHECNTLTAVTLPEGVEEIMTFAFMDCRHLTSVTLPESLKKIYPEVFRGCTRLREVRLGQNTRIPVTCFPSCCRRLVAPGLSPAGLKTPYAHALLRGFLWAQENGQTVSEEQKNEYLRYIRGHRKSLYPLALQERPLLMLMAAEKIIRREDMQALLAYAEEEKDTALTALLIDYQQKTFKPADELKEWEKALKAAETGILPAADAKKDWQYESAENGGVRILGYKGTEKNVAVPRMIGRRVVTEIGYFAFTPNTGRVNDKIQENRKKIETVYIPDGVTVIRESAFYNCKNLTYISLPGSLTSIETNAFSGCTALTSVTLPESLKSIGQLTFSHCLSLASVTFPAGMTGIDLGAFKCCKMLSSVTVPGSVKCLSHSVFYECKGLKELVLERGVRRIEGCILENCPGPVTVTVPRTVRRIDTFAFRNAEEAVTLRVKRFSYAFWYALRHRLRYEIAEKDE